MSTPIRNNFTGRGIVGLFGLVLFFVLALGLLGPAQQADTALTPGWAPAAEGEGTVTLGATATSQHFSVHAHTEETAQQTLRLAENAWDQLAPRFRHTPAEGIIIVVVEDDEEYDTIEPIPRTQGFATYGGNRIYLRGSKLTQETATHELAHILLGANVRPGVQVPDWFNEGLAQYVSGADGSDLSLFYAYQAGDFLPLSELSRVDALHGPDREMATIQGLAIVSFLVSRHGEARLWNLVARLGRAPSFERALHDTYDTTQPELNADWSAYAEDRYGFFSPAAFQFLGWALMGLLAALGAVTWVARRATLSQTADTQDLTGQEIADARRAEEMLRYQEELDRRRRDH